MSDINLIKTVLFNAANLNDALTKLTELGIQYRACTFTDNGYHITGHDITFWPTQSLRCPLAVCINGNLFDYDDRRSFLAGQCETVETPVPAASPDTTGQHPILSQYEIQLVQQYRTGQGFNHNPAVENKGFVILYRGEICGWMLFLSNPQGYCPGCIAVDADLNCWLSVGGNDYDGAEKWVVHQTGQRLVTLSRNAVTGTVSYLSIKTIPFQTLRNTLREERRLKGSRVKGLSS